MFREVILVLWMTACVACFQMADAADETVAKEEIDPVVVMETSEGIVHIELWMDKAPATVNNFLHYVDEGLYDGTVFHRVIDDFMIQGGGFTPDMKKTKTFDPIKNEATATLRNDRSTLAMARTNDINSATSQFFINVRDNDFLNHRDETPRGFGYAVFGKVIQGMEVVDRIGKVETTSVGPHDNVPLKPVTIVSIKRLENTKKDTKKESP